VGLLGADGSSRPAQVNIDASLPLPTHEGPRVVLHAGSGGYSLARRWDPVYFAQVADTLQREHNAQVIIVGGSDDNAAEVDAHMETTPLNLAGKTTLPQLAGVIQQADLFIGADSGVMHIASATGTPIIAVFGPSNHRAWSPWTPNGQSLVVRSGPLCSPCSYVDHHIGLREGCPARTCMRMVTPEVVLRAVVRYIEQGQLPTADALPPGPTSRRTVEILGLPVDAITYPQWLDTIEQWVHSGKPHHVCTLNPEFVMIAQRDPNFQHILQRADLCVPDGVGLLWAARYLGQPLPGRVTGSDGVPIIAERAARQGWRLYLLGAAPGVAARAADILQSRYPGLEIAGVYSGSPTPEAEDDIVRRVNNSDANILLVAYGAPQQDTWIARNLPRLEVQMAMGVGGAFDFIAGVIPRAPLWMRRAGLEWLYRLYLQPSRIGRMTRLPRFVLAVILRGKKR
jgi:N-acetylglucosaminyldiphosphoundecaprenol N-acetyl-beta-D-mannosaminyltransferase